AALLGSRVHPIPLGRVVNQQMPHKHNILAALGPAIDETRRRLCRALVDARPKAGQDENHIVGHAASAQLTTGSSSTALRQITRVPRARPAGLTAVGQRRPVSMLAVPVTVPVAVPTAPPRSAPTGPAVALPCAAPACIPDAAPDT